MRGQRHFVVAGGFVVVLNENTPHYFSNLAETLVGSRTAFMRFSKQRKP